MTPPEERDDPLAWVILGGQVAAIVLVPLWVVLVAALSELDAGGGTVLVQVGPGLLMEREMTMLERVVAVAPRALAYSAALLAPATLLVVPMLYRGRRLRPEVAALPHSAAITVVIEDAGVGALRGAGAGLFRWVVELFVAVGVGWLLVHTTLVGSWAWRNEVAMSADLWLGGWTVSLLRFDFWLVSMAVSVVLLAARLGLEDPRRAPAEAPAAPVQEGAVGEVTAEPARPEQAAHGDGDDDVDHLFDTPDQRRRDG